MMDDFETPVTKKPYVIMVVGSEWCRKNHDYRANWLISLRKPANPFIWVLPILSVQRRWSSWLSGENVWGSVIKQKMGADPASVAFDTLSSAVANNADVVIIDTAGRLHNKVGLMNELTKIKNVMKKVVSDAPNEVCLFWTVPPDRMHLSRPSSLLWQRRLRQLAVTKLDGTAKGGVVIGISDQFKIPVKYIGLGEGIEDLQVFRKKSLSIHCSEGMHETENY